jgi:hypothetical protein
MGASGQSALDFGTFPGAAEASLDVSGQAGFVVTSEVEAWVLPVTTAVHSVDEHLIENLRVMAYWTVDGTFKIRAYVVPFPQLVTINGGAAQKHLLHGTFNIGWAWV